MVPNAPWGPINREGRNEFQLLIALASLVGGVMQLVTNRPPAALRDMSTTSQTLWVVLLSVSGALILASAAGKKTTGAVPYLETGGLLTLGCSLSAYGLGILIRNDGESVSFGTIVFFMVALACFSRAARIFHAVWWPKTYEAKLREEIKRQAVESALRQAEEISGEKHDPLSTDTDPGIPIAMAIEDDEDER